ncbi:MAG: hypothetical protein ACOYJL_05940 [Tractidigestivibacter sp.]|jgi:hypothetical protein|uniref:hypothetical protein n=1 Tax=Tractidigestivibacter sp. TaxID=2847320 RepID=UPI003D8DD00A
MAGYLITFKDEASCKKAMKEGRYSPLMSPKWSSATESTLGDFVTMKPGDKVYFFTKRKIYGIGRILDWGDGITCVREVFPEATNGKYLDVMSHPNLVVDRSNKDNPRIQRWEISFYPCPRYFSKCVDMDEMLESNPSAFRSLRVFWKRSFIKLDDEEQLAFDAALLHANRDEASNVLPRIEDATIVNSEFDGPNITGLVRQRRNSNRELRSEMTLEVGLLHQLTIEDPETIEVFGRWDFLSHQVPASPFKPVDYMDKMDVFGYRWIKGYKPIIDSYLVAELKKDTLKYENVLQVMRYVEWISTEYASGDYSLITAYLVSSKIPDSVIGNSAAAVKREYVRGRPLESRVWNNLTFVEYSADESGHISFKKKALPGC